MRFLISVRKLTKSAPFWLTGFWAFILLANFIPVVPQPSAIIGYLWKVEFFLALFLLTAILVGLRLSKNKENLFNFSKREIFLLILPVVLFVIWSGFSAFWADAPRSAVHHTLLWACYAVFYILARIVVRSPRLLEASFKFTGVVIAVLALACLIEYFSIDAANSVLISLRYSKYAEASAVVLPVFIALAFKLKNRAAVLSGLTALAGWTIVVFSLGRTQLIAALAGIIVFSGILLLKSRRGLPLKKAGILTAGFILVFALSQTGVLLSNSQQTTIKRFSGGEPNAMSLNSRFLFWQVAGQVFLEHPVLGAGADNFINSYKDSRANFADANPEYKHLNLFEEAVPERAHSEYLQILAELGIVGGLIFALFLCGVGGLFFEIIRQRRVSTVSIGAFAGLAAFLVSSLASSYSFRVPANAVCFFFALALAAEGLLKNKEKLAFDFVKIKPAFAAAGAAVCVLMIIFSGIRGASLMYLEMSLKDEKNAENYLKKAHSFDETDALINYYYGMRLHKMDFSEDAIPHLQTAIDKGIVTSIAYYQLYAAQVTVRRDREAEETLQEALRVFPQSVFLRTAYAEFLRKIDCHVKSEIELAKARKVDAAQAESWWLAQTEGAARLNETANEDEQFVEVMQLKPDFAVYCVLDFQRRNNPKLVLR